MGPVWHKDISSGKAAPYRDVLFLFYVNKKTAALRGFWLLRWAGEEALDLKWDGDWLDQGLSKLAGVEEGRGMGGLLMYCVSQLKFSFLLLKTAERLLTD